MGKWKEVGMTNPRYLGLRIVLFIFFIVIAASGVLMILGGKTLVMWAFMHPPEREVSNLFMMMLKQMGGILLMLSLMLYFAFRDPVKNIAIFERFSFRTDYLSLDSTPVSLHSDVVAAVHCFRSLAKSFFAAWIRCVALLLAPAIAGYWIARNA